MEYKALPEGVSSEEWGPTFNFANANIRWHIPV
jgi:hypothetical protein